MAPPTGTLPAPVPLSNATDGPPAPTPGPPARRWWPPSVVGTLCGLLVLLVVLLAIAAVAGLGVAQRAQRDQDAALTPDVQHAVLAHRVQGEFERAGQAWRTVLLQGWNTGARPGYVQEFRDRSAAVDALAAQLQDQLADRTETGELVAFRNEHRTMNRTYESALAAFVAAGGNDPAVPLAATEGRDAVPAARLAGLVDRLDAAAAADRADRQAALVGGWVVLLVLGLLIAAVVGVVLAVVVRRVLRPLRRLAHQADRTARQDLPAALARFAALPDAEAPTLPPPPVDGGDEWGILGRALVTVQDTAIGLAVQQRRTDREAARTLVNLARRNQNLVESAQVCLDGLGDGGRDPAVVDGLARLAGTTGRIRRSADSMLVLGGAAPARRVGSRPVPVPEIVNAATAEIADGARVDVLHIEEAAIVGAAVPDVTHLLAELLENATHFSPPDSAVTVVGRFGSSGRYELHVVDQGIGMAGPELAEANARIAEAASCARPDAHRLGLRVVGRLAARLTARVTLHPSSHRGVTALVDLPGSTVIDLARTGAEHDGGTPARGTVRSAPSRSA